MERTYIKDLKTKIGQQIILKGFAQTIRDQGGIKFIILRDVTGTAQVVILKAAQEPFELVKQLSHESVLEVQGTVKEEKQAPQGIEVSAEKITVLSKADPELPIPVVEKSQDETEISKRFDYRWIDLRKEEKMQIFKVWTELEKGFRKVFENENFIQLYTPSFMSSPSESGAEVFEVPYFETKAYLAQSPQFYKQMGMAAGFEKVFMFVPAFRAEPSYTARHMTEFTTWDFEMSYIENHHSVMDFEERLIISSMQEVKNTLGLELQIPASPFPRITMLEAKKLLAEAGIKSDKAFDVSGEEEIKLSEIVKQKYDHDFVFLTDWPIEGRAFYHMRYDENPNITKGFDLIYKGIEVTTGAQREHRPEKLLQQAISKGLTEEGTKDYINFFRYGCPPHGGLAFGPGRFVMKLLGLSSVKDATYLPRDVKRLTP